MIDELNDVRKVRKTKKLMDEFVTRDAHGNRLTWTWNSPDNIAADELIELTF